MITINTAHSSLENNTFNKTLIVGHKFSYTNKVFHFFKQLDMQESNTKIPYKLSKRILLDHQYIHQYTSQLQLNDEWKSFAIKAFLKNSQQNWWGWSDSQAVTLLNYWSSSHPKLSFVLVYSSPEVFLHNYLKNHSLKEENLLLLLEEWYNYTTLLLEFFLKNQDRTLLINAEELKNNPDKTYQSLKSYLIEHFPQIDFPEKITDLEKKTKSNGFTTLIDFFLHQYLQEKPQFHELFNELEAVSSIPLKKEISNKTLLPLEFTRTLLSFKKVQKRVPSLKEKSKINSLQNMLQEKEQENEELLTQLMHVQEELEKYYLENQNLKNGSKEKKRYYGAEDRIKEQLSYRLGKNMIEKSKSFFGILGLPFSLMRVHSEYKKDMQAKKGKKLPPIESYADAYEAKRVKKHLSYMLGQTMIETMKSNPFRVFILPFKLHSTYKLYKKQREV